jgi:hypothetical protein
MNCAEVQQVLPEIIEGSGSPEYRAHLKSCLECSELVSDLELIAGESRQLAEVDEPADRVWVRIAAELRAEGIIREPEATPVRPVVAPSARRRWNAWWLVPAAVALVVVGSYVIKPQPASTVGDKIVVVAPQSAPSVAQEIPVVAQPAPVLAKAKKPPVLLPFPKDTAIASEQDDQEFLRAVSRSAPMMRATYENQLRTVNSYIRDAQAYADQNPGDEDARQHLMDAFEQKSMLYQMALDNVQ